MRRGRAEFVILALTAAAAGCSLLLDPDATQCRSDSECAQFGASVCDRASNICVSASSAPTPGAGGVANHDAGAFPDGSAVVGGSDAQDLPSAQRCMRQNKPLVTIEREIASDDRLECDQDYLLVGTVLVKPGVTLTVAPGTTVRGDKDTKGTLVVQPGGRLLAVGTRDQPIVFTSALEEKSRRPGDWGGVILLGRAPVNGNKPKIEGITEGGEYGGDVPTDSSGILKYVRIEYSGTKLGPNNEINGLTLGGVGSGTIIDYVQVRMTTDDCFEFFGGTVNAKHLLCQYNGDDGVDWDLGYRGKLQFVVVQQDPSVVDETNGFEGDNDATASLAEPISEPTIYNATLCGKGVEIDKQQYGLLLRKSTRGKLRNLFVSGFEAGLDLRDATTSVDLASAVFFGNLVKNLAYEEDDSDNEAQKNDDGAFDERTWLGAAERRIATVDLGIACFDAQQLRLGPKMAVTTLAEAPPNDGFFDPRAGFIGAFRDAADDWAAGSWVVWRDK